MIKAKERQKYKNAVSKRFYWHIAWALLFLLCSVVSVYWVTLVGSQARLASNVIGQTDTGGNITYTKKNPDNSYPNAKGFYNPYDLSVDTANHRLFAGDYTNNRVLVFNLDNDNNLADRTADYVLGQADFTSNVATTTQSGLSGPVGILYVSSTNQLFVSDSVNNRVVVYDVNSITNGENATNVLGQSDFTTSTAATTQSGLSGPYFLAYDSVSTTLFVADAYNSRVMMFDVSTIIDGENATNVLGQSAFNTADCNTTQSGLCYPFGLAFNPNDKKLFVSDLGNYRIMVFDANAITDGENAVNVLGQPNFTSANATVATNKDVYNVYGMAIDAASNTLYVAEQGHNRVVVFDVTTINDYEEIAYELGQADMWSATAITTQNGMNGPVGVAVGAGTKNLYVADATNNRVVVFDVNVITNYENAADLLGQVDESGLPVYTTDYFNNTEPSASGLYKPYDTVVDTAGHRLFVSDSGNNRVLVFNLDSSNTLVDYTADYVLGQADFTSKTATTTATGLDNPQGITYDSERNYLFVAEYDNNRVVVYDVASITNGETAVNVLGQADFTSKTATTTATGLDRPVDVIIDTSTGRLYISEYGNRRVLVYDVSSTISDGMAAGNVLGQANFTSATGATTQASIRRPTGLALDEARQYLFAIDDYNNRVMVFDVNTIVNNENAINVLGQADFASSDAAVTQNQFYYLESVAYNEADQLLFVSDFTTRILIFDLSAISNGENAIQVIGQADFTSVVSTVNQQLLGANNSPGLYYDNNSHRLYVTSYYGNTERILIFDLPVQSAQSASPLLGVIYNAELSTSTNIQGTAAFTVSSGTIPTGMTMVTTTGYLTGTPTATGTFAFTVKGADTDANGEVFDYQDYSVTVGYPTVAFSSTSSEALESAAGTPFVVTISNTSTLDAVLTFSISGTATADKDYVSSTSATITAGNSSVTLPVSITDDTTAEENETIIVTLSSVTNAQLGANTTHTFTIGNDDTSGSIAPSVFFAPDPPKPTADNPKGEFKMSAIGGQTEVSTNTIALKFFTGADTKRVALSDNPDFINAMQTDLTPTTSWEFCSSNPSSTNACVVGKSYTVYAKFYTRWGFTSPVVSMSVKYTDKPVVTVEKKSEPVVILVPKKSATAPAKGKPLPLPVASVAAKPVFRHYLYMGSVGNEVRALQRLLIKKGYLKNASVSGRYAAKTKQAVKKLQAAYGLQPLGVVGPNTRKLLNALVNQ